MYSFDVFDTLITRRTGSPQGIFALMRDRLGEERAVSGLDGYVIDNFYELRIHSEELARKSAVSQQGEEVTLRDIYAALALCGCLDARQTEYLARLEQELEIANVTGLPENIQRVRELLRQGERVVLISDMYLPEETIRQMLSKADEILGRLPLYVSSEYGMRKTTGNLYRLVQEKEGVGFGDWTHIGDNLHQDIEVPYWLGIRVELTEQTWMSDFEKGLLETYGDDSRLQLTVGAAKMGAKQPEAYRIGYRYAGPLLYSYAEWIVDQAVKKGLKRLYFIARDGYLAKRIVDIMLDKRGIDIATGYIYGSRKAWRMPSLSKEHYNLYQMFLWSHYYKITSLGILAATMHVPLEELYGYLPGIYAKDREDDRISARELEYIVRKLSGDREFWRYHLQRLQEERALCQEYLAQEIDTSDDSFAFVDVAGGGLTQGCLRELIKDRYQKPIHTFFFKIDRVNLAEGSVTDTFMPGFLKNDLIIEMICRAPHGQTGEYARQNGKVVPVLEEAESRLLIEHGFYDYERGIEDFARRMCDVSLSAGISIGSMKNVLLYLKHIGENPSGDVLEYFASTPNNETGRDAEAVEYAPRLTRADMEAIFLGRTNEPLGLLYKGTDFHYSLLRATEEERALIERYKREHDGMPGRLYRQKAELEQRALRERYGGAAFYPVRLLEEKLVIYGAGKFGRNLYRRLADYGRHKIVLWADKNASACRQQLREDFSVEVQDVSALPGADFDQIVIAVADKELAGTIRKELRQMGIAGAKMIWLPPCGNPGMAAEWESKGIG